MNIKKIVSILSIFIALILPLSSCNAPEEIIGTYNAFTAIGDEEYYYRNSTLLLKKNYKYEMYYYFYPSNDFFFPNFGNNDNNIAKRKTVLEGKYTYLPEESIINLYQDIDENSYYEVTCEVVLSENKTITIKTEIDSYDVTFTYKLEQ